MNKFFVTGRLTKDPEKRTTQSGVSVCTFTIATDRRYKNSDGSKTADFFPIVCWRQLADLSAEYLSKGRMVAIIGEMQTRSYDKDGQRHYVTECVADEVQFLSPKGEGGNGGQSADLIPADDSDLPF